MSGFPTIPKSTPLEWIVAALVAIASSSAFYTWVWYRPGDFKKLIAPSDPCSVMATMAHGLKALQFYCIYKCTDLTVFSGIPAWQWVAAGTLLAAGQHLNMRVYQLLGQDGVYYGSRFGKTIPWASAWPYNSLRDPQYIGCLLSLAGMASFMPAELVAWWAGNYFYLMWLESSVPAEKKAKKKA